jgi:hypothetical protein
VTAKGQDRPVTAYRNLDAITEIDTAATKAKRRVPRVVLNP